MSKDLGARLPSPVQEAFSDARLQTQLGKGYVVTTVDEDGAPRLSMLSAGEIVTIDDRHFRLGLWPGSHTGRNIASGRPMALCYVAPQRVLYVHGRGRRLGGDEVIDTFEVLVERVRSDRHEGLPVHDTVTFDCEAMTPDELVAMWSDRRARIHAARDGDE